MTAALGPASEAGAAGTLPVTLRLGVREWLPPAAVLVVFVAGWELVCVALQLKQFVLPRPTAIATAWVTYLPDLAAAASFTFWEIVSGLLMGSAAGITAGLATARFAAAREAVLPFAIAANSVPILAFAPIFNNWFGVETQLSKAMVAAVLCFFPVMINTVRGLTAVPAASVELMRSYAAGETTVFRKLRVPNALPFVFTALRLATTLATIGAIVGEYFAAPRASLGQYIATHSSFLNFERSWAAIIFAAAIGIGLYLAVVLLERAVMPWLRTAPQDIGR